MKLLHIAITIYASCRFTSRSQRGTTINYMLKFYVSSVPFYHTHWTHLPKSKLELDIFLRWHVLFLAYALMHPVNFKTGFGYLWKLQNTTHISWSQDIFGKLKLKLPVCVKQFIKMYIFCVWCFPFYYTHWTHLAKPN